MISKKVLLGLLNFFLSFFPPLLGMEEEHNFFPPMLGMEEKHKKHIIFQILPISPNDKRLEGEYLKGCQLINILGWKSSDLSLYKKSIFKPKDKDVSGFIKLIERLAKINDTEEQEQIKIKNMRGSKSKEGFIINNKKHEIKDSSSRSVGGESEYFSCLRRSRSEDYFSYFPDDLVKDNQKEIQGSPKDTNTKQRGFISRMVLSGETEENVNKVLTGISTLLKKIEKKGIEGLDQDVSKLVKELTETTHLLNNDVLVELKECLQEVKNLASGLNQTQGELHDKIIPETLKNIDNILRSRLEQIDSIAKKHIDALNENFLVNKLKSLNPKNITIAIATLASIYPFWSILRFYLNNEELKADHISKAWLWSRAGLTIFFPLITGYLCDIIISANSNLSDFIQYNVLFVEYKKNQDNIIKRLLSFEALLLLISFVLLYKNFDWIQKHNILPEVILSYAFFVYAMIFNGEGGNKWKQHLTVFFSLYAILIMYKLHQAPVLDINLLKEATYKSFYKNIFFNLLAILKWHSRILITGAAPYGAHAFLNFLRAKIDDYIKHLLQKNEDYLKKYDFVSWSNKQNQKNQFAIKPKEQENVQNLELIEEENIESTSKKDIIDQIITEYTVKIKVGDSIELTWINKDDCGQKILEQLRIVGLIYYYNQELLTKKKILSKKTIIEYQQEIKNLKEIYSKKRKRRSNQLNQIIVFEK